GRGAAARGRLIPRARRAGRGLAAPRTLRYSRAMRPAASSDVDGIVERLSLGAREAARVLARASSATKDRALRDAAAGLRGAQAALLAANRDDVERARAAGESAAFVDRLTLNPHRIQPMAPALDDITPL